MRDVGVGEQRRKEGQHRQGGQGGFCPLLLVKAAN